MDAGLRFDQADSVDFIPALYLDGIEIDSDARRFHGLCNRAQALPQGAARLVDSLGLSCYNVVHND